MTQGALSDLRVVEFGHYISGPFCGKLFADLGAEVIKVEEPAGDEARAMGPFPGDVPHPEKSGLFLYLNTNKRGVTLNPHQPEGARLFKELVREVDILIENHRPGKMERLGLGYEALKEVNPRLIMTSISPFGQTGPYKDYKATDLINWHLGGEAYETPVGGVPDPDRLEDYPPLKAGGRQSYFVAGYAAAMATMMALFHRRLIEEGQQVDISEHQVAAACLRPNVPRYYFPVSQPEGWSRQIRTTRVSGGAMACKDGYVSTRPTDDRMWAGLMEAMGNPEWAQNPLLATRDLRTVNSDFVNAMIEPWFAERTKEEVFHLLQKHQVSCFPVYTVAEALSTEHMKQREFLVELEHPEAGRLKYPGPLAKFAKSPWRFEKPAPTLGQHNEEVYGGHLGYATEDLVRLRGLGII